MIQILQFETETDLWADLVFSSYTGLPPNLHISTSAQPALGLS